MRHKPLIALATFAAALAGPAVAQVPPFGSPHQSLTDRHRFEMDRLRLQADQRDLFARQQALESSLTRNRIQSGRADGLNLPETSRPYTITPEATRSTLTIQTQRRETVVRGVTQIDDWLDRGPR